MASYDQNWFITRAQQLFAPVLNELVTGLSAIQAQAKIMAALATLQATWTSYCFIDSATGIWLDLHAMGRGINRQTGETDAQLRNRIRLLPDIISPGAFQRMMTALMPPGIKWEVEDAATVALIADSESAELARATPLGAFLSYDPVYSMSFEHGSVLDPPRGAPQATFTQTVSGTGTPNVASVGRQGSPNQDRIPDGSGLLVTPTANCGLTFTLSVPKLPDGVWFTLSVDAYEVNSAHLTGTTISLTIGGVTTTVNASAGPALVTGKTSGGTGASIQINVPNPGASPQGSLIIDEMTIAAGAAGQPDQSHLLRGGFVPVDFSSGSFRGIVLHIGGGFLLDPNVNNACATAKTSGANDSDCYCDSQSHSHGLDTNLQVMTAILAAALAMRAAGTPVFIRYDPSWF